MKQTSVMSKNYLYLFMTLHVLGAAGTFIFSKAATVSFANPMVLTVSRGLGSAVIFLMFTGWKIPKPDFTLREWFGLLGLGVLLVPLNQYCFLKGLELTVPGHSALLYAMTPLGVLLVSSIRIGTMPSLRKFAGVFIAFSGVVIVLRPWASGAQISEMRTGDLWLIAAVFCWVLYTVLASDICRKKNALTVTAWSLILGVLIMLPIAVGPLMAFDFSAVSTAGWFGLGYMIVITSSVMMILWNILLQHLTPVQVAITTNAQPPATTLLAAVTAAAGFLPGHQDLGPVFILGMVLSLSGVIIIQKALD
ncbi:DMT family transporter [Desulfobacula sp.]|uniref:DMT family transporter n=1 Tax=Desulfobacula sp. TaxID=2593537 RepID=UPI0025C0CCD7|nr:DMT family transporter [Desulfobacula sp.]MBC2703963.1 DMT family transporter [Desulfobacula sp.]